VPFSYDTGHDTAPERLDVDQHLMVITLTSALWLAPGEDLIVEISAVCPGTAVLDIYPARVGMTLRL